MTRRALIVCGSRSLLDHAGRRAWAEAQIYDAVSSLNDDDLLLAGGTDGPEVWAAIRARRWGLDVEEFRLDGYRWSNGLPTPRKWPDLLAAQVRESSLEWPLKRNLAMLAALEHAAAAGWEVGVLGLVDPDATTQSTSFTTERAVAALGAAAVARLVHPQTLATRPAWLPWRFSVPRVGSFMASDYCVFDTETTALSPKHGAIIELAMIRTERNHHRVRATFETKLAVPPWAVLEAGAVAVNGYDPAAWRGAPTFDDVRHEVARFLHQAVWVGHRVAFDEAFLASAFARVGDTIPAKSGPSIDTVRVAKQALPHLPNHKLTTVAGVLDIPDHGAHRAMPDAWRCWKAFCAMVPYTTPKPIPKENYR